MGNKALIVIFIIAVLAIGVYFILPTLQGTLDKTDTTNQENNPNTPSANGQNSAEQNQPEARTVNVSIQNFAFMPAEIRIKAGDKVVWTNKDTVGHSATSDAGAFDSKILSQSKSYEQTFSAKGTFSYFCLPHPNMKGKVIVE